MTKEERLRDKVAQTLEAEIRQCFLSPYRDRYRFTFLASIPGEPTMDVLVTQHEPDDLRAAIDRMLKTAEA